MSDQEIEIMSNNDNDSILNEYYSRVNESVLNLTNCIVTKSHAMWRLILTDSSSVRFMRSITPSKCGSGKLTFRLSEFNNVCEIRFPYKVKNVTIRSKKMYSTGPYTSPILSNQSELALQGELNTFTFDQPLLLDHACYSNITIAFEPCDERYKDFADNSLLAVTVVGDVISTAPLGLAAQNFENVVKTRINKDCIARYHKSEVDFIEQ